LNDCRCFCRSSADGYFKLFFPEQSAGGPYTLKISANDESVEIKNILIGDLYLASGQSNMAYRLNTDSRADKTGSEIPLSREQEKEFLKKHPPEYLILGQHYVDFEYFDGRHGNHSDSGASPCSDRTRIKPFADIVIEAMSTGLFSCVAHPDVLTYTGPDQDYYLSEMARIIEASKKYGVPLEYNLLGQKLNRQYPRLDFWRLAGELGASVVLGCDAHSPERVADKDEINEARRRLKECKVKILDTIELIRPFK
jgi:histidinol phosphatase-like PHP family hydrolase